MYSTASSPRRSQAGGGVDGPPNATSARRLAAYQLGAEALVLRGRAPTTSSRSTVVRLAATRYGGQPHPPHRADRGAEGLVLSAPTTHPDRAGMQSRRRARHCTRAARAHATGGCSAAAITPLEQPAAASPCCAVDGHGRRRARAVPRRIPSYFRSWSGCAAQASRSPSRSTPSSGPPQQRTARRPPSSRNRSWGSA